MLDYLIGDLGLGETPIFGNTPSQYLQAAIIFAVLLFVFAVFQQIILIRLEAIARRTRTDIDDAVLEIVHSVKPSFYFFLALYFALTSLTLQPTAHKVFTFIIVVWAVVQIILALQNFIDYLIKKVLSRENHIGTQSAWGFIRKFSKASLWLVGALFILSNMGINITSLIAGLGIGGIAIALALQSILSDLLSSFAIFFDKPFTEGDFIVVGNDMGVVKQIGMKTTRIQALQGEEIVISNQELTSTRVQNFKKLTERRVAFGFGVVYETTSKKLELIPEIIREVIENTDGVRFDRAHFYQFGASSLDFEVVYYIANPDYNAYMDTHQSILLTIRRELEKQKVDMAFPTQTIHLAKK